MVKLCYVLYSAYSTNKSIREGSIMVELTNINVLTTNLLTSRKVCFTILQSNDPMTFLCRAAEETYSVVWASVLFNCDGYSDESILEYLFRLFNRVDETDEMPRYYRGRSLTAGDRVILDGKTYLCDFCGWKELK